MNTSYFRSFWWEIRSPNRRGWLADRLAKGERPYAPILARRVLAVLSYLRSTPQQA
jgi:hypothetical protein